MNIFFKGYCRIYQKSLKIASHFIPFPEPKLIEGSNSLNKVPSILKDHKKIHPLIVSGKTISRLGLFNPLLDSLKAAGIEFTIFDETIPNPTFEVVEKAYLKYKENDCDSIIAFGGGSTIDAAKAIGVKAIYPSRDLSSFKKILSVHHKTPFLIAIPTTAGTGSEATVAAVLIDSKTKDKFSINDPVLIPDVAILDDTLLSNLPSKTIAETGMDALTHALEAYIGRSSTIKTNEYALTALKLIQNYLYDFYSDHTNEIARANMQKASYLAGVSFTKAYIGYVHALAHALGGYYNISHGLANAILLPYVLEAYDKKAYRRLAEICDDLSLIDPLSDKASKSKAVIAWIRELNEKMGIPSHFGNLIKNDAELEFLAEHAYKEANPLYPVPKELGKEKLKEILIKADQTN